MPTPGDALNHIGQSFVILFQEGDIGGFLNELLKGAPLVGVFLIIYILGRFLSAKTIFRGAETKTYENMFGLGLALVGLFTPNVYAFITTVLGGTFIMIMAFIFIVSAIIIQITRARGTAAQASSETHKALAESNKSQKESSKARHDKKMAKRMNRKEKWAVRHSQDELHSIRVGNKNLKTSLKDLRDLLKHLGGIRDEGEASKIKEQIMKQASIFRSHFKKEYSIFHDVKGMTKRLKKLSVHELNVEKDEDMHIDKVKETIRKKLHEHHGDEDLENRIAKESKNIELIMRNYVLPLQKKFTLLINRAQEYENAEEHDYQHVNQLVEELIQALNSGDYDRSVQLISKIDSELDRIQEITEELENLMKEERSLEDKRRQAEDQINSLFSRISHQIKKDKKSSS
ncbi:MAG: hypothetical protein ACLFTH_04540 [Candidatus Woesearchaeota archaeon]